MSSTSRRSPAQKPVAILIATQMRMAQGSGGKPHKPVAVGKALHKAMNSSPQARAAFKQNKTAVSQAKPHLKALANRQGQGLMSSLKHGVSAMRSLKQVTRDMGKQPGGKTLKVESNVPLGPKAQKHMDGIARAMEGPKPKLFSALGQGIGLMRELRKTTRQMKQDAMQAPHRDDVRSKADPRALSTMSSLHGAGNPQGQGRGMDLMRALGQGMTLMQGVKDVTRTLKTMGASGGATQEVATRTQAPSSSRRGGDSPLAIMLIARRRGSPPGDESTGG